MVFPLQPLSTECFIGAVCREGVWETSKFRSVAINVLLVLLVRLPGVGGLLTKGEYKSLWPPLNRHAGPSVLAAARWLCILATTCCCRDSLPESAAAGSKTVLWSRQAYRCSLVPGATSWWQHLHQANKQQRQRCLALRECIILVYPTEGETPPKLNEVIEVIGTSVSVSFSISSLMGSCSPAFCRARDNILVVRYAL